MEFKLGVPFLAVRMALDQQPHITPTLVTGLPMLIGQAAEVRVATATASALFFVGPR
jgi:hypothetical protein